MQSASLTQSGAITSSGGDVSLLSAGDNTQSGTITSDGGTISITAGDNQTQLADAALVQSGTIASGGGGVSLTSTEDVTQSGAVTTDGGVVIVIAGDNNTAFADAALVQSGTIASGGGGVSLTSTEDVTQSGAITTDGGDVTFIAGLTSTGFADTDIVTSGSISTTGGTLSLSALDDITGLGTYGTVGGNVSILATDEIDFATSTNLTSDNGSLTFAARDVSFQGNYVTGTGAVSVTADDNITFGGSLTTTGADILLSNDVIGVDQVVRVLANSAIETNDGNVTFLSSQGSRTDLMIEDTARINAGSGQFDFTFTGEASLTGLTTSNASDAAVVVNARTIKDSGDARDDITINSNGNLTLRAAKYINLNKVDYNGSENLGLALTSSTQGASVAGIVLDIDAEAGIDISQLYSRNASILAGLSSDMSIEDGRIRDELFLNIGDFDARIGRLRDNTLVPSSWVEDSEDADFFISSSAIDGLRSEDYRCTGKPNYIGNDSAVLNFNFFFDSPNVDCSGLLTFYRLPYVLVNPKQSSEQQLNNYVTTMSNANSVSINPTSSVRLEQAILTVDRNFALVEQGLEPSQIITQDASRMGLSDAAVASEFAKTFGVRETSATGVVQIDFTDIIQIGLPIVEQAPNAPQDLLDQEEDEAEEPTEEATAEDDVAPLAAIGDNAPVGPLSLLLN